MKKAIAVALVLAVVCMLFPNVVKAEEILPEKRIDEYDLSGFDEYFEAVGKSLGEENFSSFCKRLLVGELDGENVLTSLSEVVLGDIKALAPLVGVLIALCLVYGVFGSAKGDFLSEELSSALRLAFSVSVAALIGIYAIKAFDAAEKAIALMGKQMQISFPFLATLLIAGGGENTALGIRPIAYFLSVIFSDVVSKFVQPLAIFSFATSLFSKLSDKVDLTKAAQFSGDLAKTVLVSSVIVFTAYLAISGSYTISRDGAAYKAARYALSQSVPVVGAYIKDGIDMAVVCSVEIKNAVGIAALVLFIATALSPIIKCYGLGFALRLSASVASPFSDGKAISLVEGVAKSVDIIGSALLCETVMYLETVFVFIMATRHVV